MLQYAYESKSLNAQLETPTSSSNNQLVPDLTFSEEKMVPFQFTVKLSPPRYYLKILTPLWCFIV